MIWTLHGNADASREALAERMVAVPERTSLWALAFPALWLAWHRLWIELAVYLVVSIFLLGLLATPYWPATLALGGLAGLYVWLEGAQLRRAKLFRNGLDILDLAEAPDAATAVMRVLDRHKAGPASRPAPVAMRPPATPRSEPGSIGLFGA